MGFKCFEYHTIKKHDFPGSVHPRQLIEVIHSKLDMDSLGIAISVTDEVFAHFERVSLHDEQILSVVERFVQGADVTNLILGNNVFLARTQHGAKNDQSKAHMRERRANLLPFSSAQLQDVIRV